jgi:hypothetical protein
MRSVIHEMVVASSVPAGCVFHADVVEQLDD